MSDAHPSSLVLLESVDAKRLVIAWQYLGSDRTNEAWARLAAVPMFRAQGQMEILRRSGLCQEDGTVAELALKYIGAHAMKGIRPATKGKA